jgi:hypothetical protein
MFLGNDYNTTKSTGFRSLMTTNLGGGRIPRTHMSKYVSAKSAAWFTKFHDKYCNENTN